ncbi:MAG: hypothetical protein RIS35_1184 [Pseudomonadota bacterium]|jgi:hypothetical protein
MTLRSTHGSFAKLAPLFLLSAALAACGGGGGSDAATETVPTDPQVGSPRAFAANYAAYIAGGDTGTFTVSGTCVGAAVVTMGAAITREAFEGQLRLWNPTRLVATVEAPPPGGSVPVPSRPCGLGNIDFTRSTYYGDAGTPIGFRYNVGEYLTANWSAGLPTVVSDGQSGRLASFERYADSRKLVSTGSATLDYRAAFEPGGDPRNPPVLVDLVTSMFAPSGLNEITETLRYRSVDGVGLRLVMLQYDYLGGARVTLTRQ